MNFIPGKGGTFRLVPLGTAWDRIFFFNVHNVMKKVIEKLWSAIEDNNRLWVLADGHCAGGVAAATPHQKGLEYRLFPFITGRQLLRHRKIKPNQTKSDQIKPKNFTGREPGRAREHRTNTEDPDKLKLELHARK
jgi:hypothetical protein